MSYLRRPRKDGTGKRPIVPRAPENFDRPSL